jgi:outer membrane protein OmpA-like peptidoglycan-associated protein
VLLGGRPRSSSTEVFVEPRAWEPQTAEPEEEPVPSDSDNDGVTDDADRCSGTPAGASVDADGCPPQAVEEEPAPVEVEEEPAPVVEEVVAPVVVAALPEPDADSDGVDDSLDRCPGTAADDAVDAGGCSITRDSDGDGVVDSSDRCENTAPGTRVDSTGCPALFGEGETRITLHNAFKSGTWDLKPEARAKLDGIARTLIAYPTMRIAIAGYSDNAGEERRNTWLSQTRADAVKLYLRQQGVPRERMTARGYGPADPIASNDTEEGRALNRRIELRKLE